MILAINTPEITSFKKNIADSIRTAYCRLFSPVNAHGCNIEACIHPAESGTSFKPVNTALSGT
jgi:hypothetical protein